MWYFFDKCTKVMRSYKTGSVHFAAEGVLPMTSIAPTWPAWYHGAHPQHSLVIRLASLRGAAGFCAHGTVASMRASPSPSVFLFAISDGKFADGGPCNHPIQACPPDPGHACETCGGSQCHSDPRQ